MTNDDKIVEVFLEISDQHLNRYSELPLPIQEKLKEKFLLIASSKESSKSKHIPKVKSSRLSQSTSDTTQQLVPQLETSNFSNAISFIGDTLIKFELTSTRENIFSGIGCVSSIAFVGLLFFGSYFNAFIACGLLVSFFYLLNITDDYILYDITNKKLLYHKKLGTKSNITELAPKRYIRALAVQGKKCSDKNKSWWEYQAVAITLDGDFIALSDFSKNSFYDIRTGMQKIGSYLQIESLDYAIPETKLETFGSGTKLQLVYNDD
ncbi:MAG: hypothetical protein KC646_18235 [Candidatus Cloacimonetes bacterium]|nr:hypothetical protein [Candidatus Cloacimonadota bacterium]